MNEVEYLLHPIPSGFGQSLHRRVGHHIPSHLEIHQNIFFRLPVLTSRRVDGPVCNSLEQAFAVIRVSVGFAAFCHACSYLGAAGRQAFERFRPMSCIHHFALLGELPLVISLHIHHVSSRCGDGLLCVLHRGKPRASKARHGGRATGLRRTATSAYLKYSESFTSCLPFFSSSVRRSSTAWSNWPFW